MQVTTVEQFIWGWGDSLDVHQNRKVVYNLRSQIATDFFLWCMQNVKLRFKFLTRVGMKLGH